MRPREQPELRSAPRREALPAGQSARLCWALPLSVLAGRSGADVRVALNLLFQEQLYLCAAAMDAVEAATKRAQELGKKE